MPQGGFPTKYLNHRHHGFRAHTAFFSRVLSQAELLRHYFMFSYFFIFAASPKHVLHITILRTLRIFFAACSQLLHTYLLQNAHFSTKCVSLPHLSHRFIIIHHSSIFDVINYINYAAYLSIVINGDSMDASKVLDQINADRYRWVDLQYTDVLGFFKTVTIPSRNLDVDSFKVGGAVIDNYSMFYDSGEHLPLIPDPNTYAVVPWEPSTVRLIARTNSPYDPRNLLSNAQDLGKKHKISFELGTEMDFYIMDSLVTDVSHFSYGAYMDSREIAMSQYDGEFEHGSRRNQTLNADIARGIRLQIGDYADLTGVDVRSLTHEKGRMQQEVALSPNSPLKAADDFASVKHLTKNAAMLVGAIATFAPKVSNNEPMSEAHINFSGWKGDDNIFMDLSGKQLSDTGYYFLAGLMDHIRSLSAFLLPTTLSYKDAVHIEHIRAFNNLVRIPLAIQGESDKRIEYRFADSSINPYLAYSALIAAGVDGINKKLSFDEGKEVSTPRSLAESLSSLLSDHDFLKNIFSDEFLHMYIDLKEREIKEVSSRISGFELAKYQNI